MLASSMLFLVLFRPLGGVPKTDKQCIFDNVSLDYDEWVHKTYIRCLPINTDVAFYVRNQQRCVRRKNRTRIILS